jgi:hypothetical protein
MTNVTLLTEQLRNHIVEVKFTKANGEQRVMRSTLREEMLPDTNGGISTATDDVITVLDVDKNEWRRFRTDSIIQTTILE